MKFRTLPAFVGWLTPLSLIASCGSGDHGPPPLSVDAGVMDTSTMAEAAAETGAKDVATESTMDASTQGSDGGDAAPAPDASDAGMMCSLTMNPAVDQNSLQSGQLLLTASGEILALTGYNFPAVNPGDPVFADGWEVRFSHFIATFDKVSLWTNPNLMTGDQSQHGPLVAELDGPWAVDLSQNGATFPYIDGKEPPERAVAFAVLTNQNKNGNQPFDTSGGTQYAVGFSAVVATPTALNVNLGPDGQAVYCDMIQNGCVARYVGQAMWRGDQGRCTVAAPVDASAEGGVSGGTGQEPEFSRIPTVVNFDLCFKPRTPYSPACSGAQCGGAVETNYVNCDNQDNAGPGLNMEPHPRGIAFLSNTYTVGEVTFHTDHPFWESTKHDTPAHFDQLAALVTGGDGGVPTVHFEDTMGLDYTGFKDKQGNPLPWRICDPNYQNPNGGSRVGQMHFDPVAVPICQNNNSSSGFCDYYDFSKYNQSTQGHWNGADGLCFVQRAYGSPP